jgi:hypothetical protein
MGSNSVYINMQRHDILCKLTQYSTGGNNGVQIVVHKIKKHNLFHMQQRNFDS